MKGTTVAWPLRAWLWAEVGFGLATALTLGLDPAQQQRPFAWPIKPEPMAALLGPFYIALVPMVLWAALARRWESVRVIVLPAAAFTTVQLGVTVLHWSRFVHDSLAFQLWFVSYLLPPPIFVACWFWQQRRRVAPAAHETPLPRADRLALALLGGLLAAEALLALAWPAWLSNAAPWAMTPLNARALAGYLLLTGLLMLSMAHENQIERVRIAAPFLVVLLPAAAWQLNRFSAQVDWQHPRIASGAVLLSACAVLGLRCLRRAPAGWPNGGARKPARPITHHPLNSRLERNR
jgi:hypothetical protein